MGVHNKLILTERVRKLEEDVDELNNARDIHLEIIKKIQSQQDRMLKVLESLTDREAYYKWLKEQEKEKEGEKPSAPESPKEAVIGDTKPCTTD